MPDRNPKNCGGGLPLPVKAWFAAAHGSGGGMMPLPFVKDILLLESSVVGTGFIAGIEKKIENIAPEQVLKLRRDPRNRYDELAIQVLNDDGERIGFIPRRDNPILARLMDAGKSLYGKVREVRDRKSWPQIELDIYLRDL